MNDVISGPIIRKIKSLPPGDTAGFVLAKKKDLEKATALKATTAAKPATAAKAETVAKAATTASGEPGSNRLPNVAAVSDSSKNKPPSNVRKRSHQNGLPHDSEATREVVECCEAVPASGNLSEGLLSFIEDRCRTVTSQFLEVIVLLSLFWKLWELLLK